ncbi:hypothetical protein OROMI_003756 [Orobanche minor]
MKTGFLSIQLIIRTWVSLRLIFQVHFDSVDHKNESALRLIFQA